MHEYLSETNTIVLCKEESIKASNIKPGDTSLNGTIFEELSQKLYNEVKGHMNFTKTYDPTNQTWMYKAEVSVQVK